MLDPSISLADPKRSKIPRETQPKCCGAPLYLTLPDGGIVVEPWRGPQRPTFEVWLVERPMLDIRQSEFITLLGGAAVWPLSAGARPAVLFCAYDITGVQG
jgi:hypothetical protein